MYQKLQNERSCAIVDNCESFSVRFRLFCFVPGNERQCCQVKGRAHVIQEEVEDTRPLCQNRTNRWLYPNRGTDVYGNRNREYTKTLFLVQGLLIVSGTQNHVGLYLFPPVLLETGSCHSFWQTRASLRVGTVYLQ